MKNSKKKNSKTNPHISLLFSEYFDWLISDSAKLLGMPTSYALDKIRSDQPPKPVIPEHIFPDGDKKKIAAVIEAMPRHHYFIIWARYWYPGKDRIKAEALGIPYITFKTKLARALEWADGYFTLLNDAGNTMHRLRQHEQGKSNDRQVNHIY